MNFISNVYSTQQYQTPVSYNPPTVYPAYPMSDQYLPPNGPQASWSHSVPNCMPWSCVNPNQYDNKFSFASCQSVPQPQLLHQPNNIWTSPEQNNPQILTCPSSVEIVSNDLLLQNNDASNFNKKRQMNPEDDVDFDFDSRRPVKKYICDDKVLEIFDRLHICEAKQYIVDDVDELPIENLEESSSVVIEELEQTEPTLKISDDIKEVFGNHKTIFDKLVESEMDKACKAVTLWQPNPIKKLINFNDKDDEDSSDKEDSNSQVVIEEVFSDDNDDEEMENIEFIEPVLEVTDYEFMQ